MDSIPSGLRRLLPALVVLLLALPQGALSQTRNKEQFRKVLGEATTKVNQTLNWELANGTLKGILSREELEGQGSGGAWRYGLSGWNGRTGDPSKVKILQGPAVVINNVGRMNYMFGTQLIPPSIADDVWEKVRKRREEAEKEYDNVQVQFGQEDGRIVMVAEIVYNDVSDGALKDRIFFLMMQSRNLLMEVEDAILDAADDLKDDLRDSRPTALGASEFEILIDDGLERLREAHPDAREGFWQFSWKDSGFKIYNQGDKILMAVWDWTYPDVLPAMRDWMKEHMDAWVAGKDIEGATLSTRWDPTEYRRFEVVATVTLDGSLQGKKIRDVYKKFTDDVGPDARKEFEKVEKSMGDRVDEANALLLTQPLEYLSWQNFNRLVPDLSEVHDDFDGVAEGWWEFTWDDRDYEIYLYGDHVEMTMYLEPPEASDEQRAAWLAEAKGWLTQAPPPSAASSDVVWYPEYEHLMWMWADYKIDGSMTGEQFKAMVESFITTYSLDFHNKATALVGGN